MAGSMKDIKLRIKSVESTMQITRAMQLVATSKLRRAKEKMETSRPYAAISRSAIMAAAASCNDETVPYITPRPVNCRLYVVIAGDRGLAGGYNANIFKLLAAHAEGMKYAVLPIGRKAVDKYARMDCEVLTSEFDHVEMMGVKQCYYASKLMTDGYLSGKFDEVFLVYTDFKNMMSQEATVEQLLPIEKPEKKESVCSTIYEPDA
ncbi:MAG: F0F1 ATP synthase subunit gamma, partial [Clostridia bacterium]|nr:F0F1 ATP synthase subunit gamma [Clostridia bacterium]